MDVLKSSRINALTAGRGLPQSVLCLALMGVALASPASATAAVITDSSFFNDKPTTLIEFNIRGNGSPVNLMAGGTETMPPDEYITKGVSFNTVYWVNDGNLTMQAGLSQGGSPKVAIPSSLVDQFAMTFSGETPVRAFGYWVVNNRTADPIGPSFIAYNSQNVVIGTVQWSAPFIDGTIVGPNTTADFGFMGLQTEQPIARVVVNLQAALFDDLRFSPVPAPGSIALAGLGGALLFRRKR